LQGFKFSHPCGEIIKKRQQAYRLMALFFFNFLNYTHDLTSNHASEMSEPSDSSWAGGRAPFGAFCAAYGGQ
jgi:hypothetical protein